MHYLLSILLPFTIAGGCYVMRRHTRLVAAIAALTVVVEAALILRAPIDEPARLLGTSVLLTGFAQLLLLALLLLAVGSLLTWAAFPSGETAAPVTLLALGFAIAAVFFQAPFTSLLFLFAAGLVSVMLVVDLPAAASELVAPSVIAVALKYLLAVVLGGTLLIVGHGLSQAATGGVSPVGFGLLLAGVGLWIGFAPFHVVLPELAEETSLLVVAVVVALQLGLLLLLIRILQGQPQLLVATPVARPLLLSLAALTAVATPLQAYGSARRIVVLLFAAHIGQILLGLGLSSPSGAGSALLGVAAHALAVALLCMSVTLLEARIAGRSETRGLLRGRPMAAAGLIVGLLVLLGTPPFGGFIVQALLWQAAWQSSAGTLLVVILGQLLQSLAAIRLVRITLLAPPRLPGPGAPDERLALLPVIIPAYAPAVLRGSLFLLMAVALLAGLYPAPVLSRVQEVVADLSFVRSAGSLP